jgi:predicted dehydrogenase
MRTRELLQFMGDKKLRWGIISTAAIAKRAVIPGIRESETGVLSAVASRDMAKAKEFADSHGIPKAYGSYEELLADKDIDAVYIPLPNHLHKEWTIRAAEAGKHILCEKPLALNAEEAQEMVDACAKHGVLLAEAFMYRHHPRYERIKQIIRDGEIGEIRGIRGAFTFNNSAAASNVRFHREMGGGSIYDVGCYPISAARLILGSEPEAATVQAFFSPQHDMVDMMASGLIEFPGNVALTFDCGMWAAGRNVLEILGTQGRIELASAFSCKADNSANFVVYTKGGRREEEPPQVNQYALQSDDLGNAVLYGKPLAFKPQDAVGNMKVIDACLKSASNRERVQI